VRLGTVVGRVALHTAVPALAGARWLVVSPFGRGHVPRDDEAPPGLGPEPTLVVYDDLGAGVGDVIGFVEGREAAMPFPVRTPVDAIDVAIVDHVTYRPAP
jgi:ethanolamine utilization protein EutN